MADDNILRALRAQAWERAKGELHAVAATFFGERSARDGQFDEFTKALYEFVQKVENGGLAE